LNERGCNKREMRCFNEFIDKNILFDAVIVVGSIMEYQKVG